MEYDEIINCPKSGGDLCYKMEINNDITIEAMSFKKMLKSLASKFKEGEIVNVVYKNKKDNLINKDVKVGSND